MFITISTTRELLSLSLTFYENKSNFAEHGAFFLNSEDECDGEEIQCDSAGYDDNDNVIMNNGEGWFKENVIEKEII